MVETALLYKDVFTRLGVRDSQYKLTPSREEWEFAQDGCKRLKFFQVRDIRLLINVISIFMRFD